MLMRKKTNQIRIFVLLIVCLYIKEITDISSRSLTENNEKTRNTDSRQKYYRLVRARAPLCDARAHAQHTLGPQQTSAFHHQA